MFTQVTNETIADLEAAIRANSLSDVEALLSKIPSLFLYPKLNICNSSIEIFQAFLQHSATKRSLKNSTFANPLMKDLICKRRLDHCSLLLDTLGVDAFDPDELFILWKQATAEHNKPLSTKLRNSHRLGKQFHGYSLESAVAKDDFKTVTELLLADEFIYTSEIRDMILQALRGPDKTAESFITYYLKGKPLQFTPKLPNISDAMILKLVEAVTNTCDIQDILKAAIQYNNTTIYKHIIAKYPEFYCAYLASFVAQNHNLFFLHDMLASELGRKGIEESNALTKAASVDNLEALELLLKNITFSSGKLADCAASMSLELILKYIDDRKFKDVFTPKQISDAILSHKDFLSNPSINQHFVMEDLEKLGSEELLNLFLSSKPKVSTKTKMKPA